MTKERISLGKQGEEQAAIYLKEAGCTIIAQNYTCPWGEIDLIAQDGSYLVFVEVRVRSSQRDVYKRQGLGYIGSYALRNRSPQNMMSMVFSVGMRNISFGSVLAVTYFPALVAVPVTLGMLYQQPLAALVAFLNKRFGKHPLLDKTPGDTDMEE